MKKNNLDLSQVRALHQTGQLDEACTGYLALLRKNPRDSEVLHSLGILYAQQENFADAIHSLEAAVKYQPSNTVFQLHLANILKAQGLFAQAASVLEKTLQDHPNYFSALNNLGTIYYAQGKLMDAAILYRRAIQIEPSFIDAYYNLGLALLKQNNLAEAVAVYQQLLTFTPNHLAARFHLACTFMRQEKLTAALTEFSLIEEAESNHFETQSNMAACYLKLGELNKAKLHYLKALELTPNDQQILFNLGVINTQQGNLDSAIQYYQKAIRVNADFFAAHNNLGVAFLAKQHLAFALHHFQEAGRLQPENQSIQYTMHMLSQNKRLLAAPTDYIKSLFDGYADHYEQHLLTALDYQLPKQFLRATLNSARLSLANEEILDIGCGTGLCGVEFKPYAKTLTGIDLSEKMLAVAAEKNIYTTLTCQEINTFLITKQAAYEVILAGDVLVYMGDLTTLFQQIKQALRANGLFIFNTEISEETDFKMNQSGRFAHQKKYLETLAKKNHFIIAHYEKIITRMQNNEPVYGHLYILRKGSNTKLS